MILIKYKTFYILIMLLIFMACSGPKARKPVTYKSGYDPTESIIFNKKLYQAEENAIKKYMANDSLHQYINSKYGFWYTYLTENKNDTIFPHKGDKVTFRYEIDDLNGNIIYSSQDLGLKNYTIDREEMIQGIQEGIKWMNKGEKARFLLPSHKAYAYTGDDDRIASNTPIAVTLELLEINKLAN